jgi:hypothetical protein
MKLLTTVWVAVVRLRATSAQRIFNFPIISFYVIRRRKIYFPQMSETEILQEPLMSSKTKLRETEAICTLDKLAGASTESRDRVQRV